MSTSFKVCAFQVLFPADEGNQIVRLNDEVKVQKDAQRLKLYPNEEDWGHITFIRSKGAWYGDFNFVYNKSVAREHLKAASEFFKAAELLYENKLLRPFVDNCFSSMELLAKVRLLLIAQLSKNKRDTHPKIRIKYDKIFKRSNSASLLNKLSGLRDSARYLKNEFSLSENDAADYLKLIKKETADLEYKLS